METTKKPLKIIIIICCIVALWAGFTLFYPLDEVQAPELLPKETSTYYTSESWKNLIDPECENFFDGCNTCFRIEGSEDIGCTQLFCENFKEPKCLQKKQSDTKGKDTVPTCNDNNNVTEQCALPLFETSNPVEIDKNNDLPYISRDEAKKLILNGNVIKAHQDHSLKVELETENKHFSTIEPKIDDIFNVIEDCGELCSKIKVGTE